MRGLTAQQFYEKVGSEAANLVVVAAKTTKQYFGHIRAGRKAPSWELAKSLQAAGVEITGEKMGLFELMESKTA